MLRTKTQNTTKMKKRIRLLLLVFSAASMVTLFSCGKAGVQVRIGDDFDTELAVNNAQLLTSASVGKNTSIYNELLDYGDFISDVEITQLVLTLVNYSGSTTGQVVIEIAGETFDTGNDFAFQDGSSFTFPNTVAFDNVAARIESGEVRIDISSITEDPLGDDSFEFVFTATVFATASDENL